MRSATAAASSSSRLVSSRSTVCATVDANLSGSVAVAATRTTTLVAIQLVE